MGIKENPRKAAPAGVRACAAFSMDRLTRLQFAAHYRGGGVGATAARVGRLDEAGSQGAVYHCHRKNRIKVLNGIS